MGRYLYIFLQIFNHIFKYFKQLTKIFNRFIKLMEFNLNEM